MRNRTLLALLVVVPILLPGSPTSAGDAGIDLRDPRGDDDGPGTYTYPTSRVYEPGSFDLTRLRITRQGDQLRIVVTFAAPIKDPWQSKGWKPPGNAFSLQLAFLFIDTRAVSGPRYSQGLPGLNVAFAPGSEWDRIVIISPQANARLEAEIREKIPGLAPAVVLPAAVHVEGRQLIALVPLKRLGEPTPAWGVQLLVQSNEGYPDADKLMTRRVDAKAGLHSFGGGRDGDCDPHVIDMLAPPGRGTPTERGKQHELLLDYTCESPARLPLVRPPVPASR